MMKGRDLIKWIQDNHAEDLVIFHQVDAQEFKKPIYFAEKKEMWLLGENCVWAIDDGILYYHNADTYKPHDSLNHEAYIKLS